MKFNVKNLIVAAAMALAGVIDVQAQVVIATIPTPSGSGPDAIAIDSVTNMIYVGNFSGGDVTVINGATQLHSLPATQLYIGGAGDNPIVVNPVTNMIYAANSSNGIAVINGATNATANVNIGYPNAMAVNPVTNMIYAAGPGNNVTVINGATNATAAVGVGANPDAIAVNPVTNMIYTANNGSNTVTVINGATDATTTLFVQSAPDGIAVNPVTNKIYVANSSSSSVTVIDGETDTVTTTVSAAIPGKIVVNPVTNKIYVVDGVTSNRTNNNVTVIDGATDTTSVLMPPGWPDPIFDMALNTVTNTIYLALSSDSVKAINLSTNAATTIGVGSNPQAIAVNSVTDMIFVANYNSNSVSVINGSILAPPTLASPASGAVNEPTSLTFNWGTVSGAASYALQVSTGSSFSNLAAGQSGLASGTGTVSGLANNTGYYWRVNATNTAGTSAWSSIWSFTTIIAPPIAPVLASPANGAGNEPVTALGLSWGASVGATSYEVEVSTSSAFGATLFDQTGASLTSATVNGLANNTIYYWRAKASNAGGTSWANAWSFTTIVAAPSTPVLASPTNGATGQSTAPALSWTTATGAASFTVQVSTGSTFANTVFSQTGTTALTATPTGLAYGGITYYWEANATNVAGTSAWSGIWSFTTLSVPNAPTLALPVNGATGQTLAPALSWTTATGAASYTVKVSTGSTFANTVFFQTGTTALTATPTGLAYGGITYYWQASASNVAGTSAWSGIWSFTTLSAPGAPTLALPTNGATNQALAPALSWTAVTGAASYGCRVSTISTFSTTLLNQTGLMAASTTASGLTSSTVYYWQANATNAAGTSVWSTVWSFTTIPPTTVPVLSSPANGTTNQPTLLTMSWGSATGALSYTLQVSASSTFAVTFINQAGITGTSESVSGLTVGSTYYWQVNATTAGGTGVWSSIWNFTTVPPLPGIPLLSSPANGAANQPASLTMSWGSAIGARSYTLQVSTSSAFAVTVINQAGITGTYGNVTGLAAGITYYWQVNATNAGGTGAWSSIWNFTTVPPPPGIPLLSSPANGAANQPASLAMSWGTVSGALSYTLQLSTASTFTATVVNQADITGTSNNVTGLAAGATYYWQINATNVAGTGAWSSVWSFSTSNPSPGVPVLSSPSNGAINQPIPLSFTWSSVTGAVSYGIQVSIASDFSSIELLHYGISQTATTASGLSINTTYYWHVNATFPDSTGNWSSTWSFTTFGSAVLPSNKIMAGPSFSLRNGTISYSLVRQCPVEIQIYDLRGKKIFEFNRRQTSGNYSLSFQNLHLSSRLYIVHFKAGDLEKEIAAMGGGGR